VRKREENEDTLQFVAETD